MKVISSGSYGKLAQDIDSRRGEAPFIEVARDQGSLTRLWNRYIAEGEQPEVSFDRSIVVFLLLPPRPTGGYGIEPKDSRLAGSTLELNAALREPGERDIVTQAFTAPYAVVRIDGLDAGVEKVLWKDEERTVATETLE